MNWICKLIGHKTDEKLTDSGFLICQRCNGHEYWDLDFAKDGILINWFFILKYRFSELIRKLRRKPFSGIKDDLPF